MLCTTCLILIFPVSFVRSFNSFRTSLAVLLQKDAMIMLIASVVQILLFIVQKMFIDQEPTPRTK